MNTGKKALFHFSMEAEMPEADGKKINHESV